MFNKNTNLIIETISNNVLPQLYRTQLHINHFYKCISLMKKFSIEDLNTNYSASYSDEIFSQSIILPNDLPVLINFNVSKAFSFYEKNKSYFKILNISVFSLIRKENFKYNEEYNFKKYHIKSTKPLISTKFYVDNLLDLLIDGNHRLSAKSFYDPSSKIDLIQIDPIDMIKFIPSKFEQIIYLLFLDVFYISSSGYFDLNNSLVYQAFKDDYLKI